MIRERAVCTCLALFQSNAHCPLPRFHCATMQAGTLCEACTCYRSKSSWDISDRSVVRSEIVHAQTAKVLKESSRCESVLRASFPFHSRTSKVQVKRPVGAGTHGHTGSTDVKSFARTLFVRASWQTKQQTDRQTEPKIKRCGPTRVCANAFMH